MGLFSPVVWTYLFNHDYLSHKLTNLHSTCCDPKNFSYCIDRSVLLRTKIRRIDMTKFRNGMGHFSVVLLREAKSQFPPFQTGFDKTRNTEHSGTCRNIPEHEKIKVIFIKKN